MYLLEIGFRVCSLGLLEFASLTCAREGEDAAFRLVRDEVKRAGLERKAKKREKRQKGRP